MRRILCKDAFCSLLTELMGWNLNNRHRMIGKMIRADGERLFLFDLSAALIYPGKAVLDEEGNVVKSIYTKSPVCSYSPGCITLFLMPVMIHWTVSIADSKSVG